MTAVAGQKFYVTQGLCSSHTGPERPSPSVFHGDKGPSQNCLTAVLLAFTAASLSMVYVYLESPECWLIHKGRDVPLTAFVVALSGPCSSDPLTLKVLTRVT